MASANKFHLDVSPTSPPTQLSASTELVGTAIEFLPDADEIERRPLPAVARITLHVCLAMLLLFLLWASFSQVDLIVVAKGRLVTPYPNIIVQPLETSIVQSISVRPGQVVKKGEQLARLDSTFSQADESQLKNRLDSLNTQLTGLERSLDSGKLKKTVAALDAHSADEKIQSRLSIERQASFFSQIQKQTESIEKLNSSLDSAVRDERALAARVLVLSEMEAMTQELVSKKLAVKSRLLDVRDRLLEAGRSMELAQSRQAEIKRELAATTAEKNSYETGWRQKILEEILTVSRERSSVADQLQKAQKRRSMVELTAPVDAVVLEIAKFSQGSIIREAETFFTLVPIGDVLEAEVEIDAQDIGNIRVGDKSDIKIDAYPFQKNGTLKGFLRTISQDAFHRNTANSSGESFYSGRLAIGPEHLSSMPALSKLLPGMSLSAEILVGKRSVISYLLWPLRKATAEALREP
jgi:HlyD family secretion protein